MSLLLDCYIKLLFNNHDYSDVLFVFPEDAVHPNSELIANSAFLVSRSPSFSPWMAVVPFAAGADLDGRSDVLVVLVPSRPTGLEKGVGRLEGRDGQGRRDVEFGDIFSHAVVYSLDEIPKPVTSEHFVDSYKQWDETLEVTGERNICDPVEMYHLANKLGLVTLEEAALRAISHCLRPEAAFDVLFSPPSILHKELRSEIVKYIMLNWRDVVQSPAYLYKELHTLPYLTRYHSVIPNDYSISSSQQHAAVIEINVLLAHNLLPNWISPESRQVNTEDNMPAAKSVIPNAIVGEAFSKAGVEHAGQLERCQTPACSYSFCESAAELPIQEKLEAVDEPWVDRKKKVSKKKK
ncbi:hypothetical protein BT69DRAFT_1342837 [Atractiella rhizophila]|nr:hypothetical protein BT69DRAFT_1342837 [Atractiella rhizophila]